MAGGIDPAGLVQDDRPGPALDEAVELAPVAHVGEDVQEVARLGGADARVTTGERSEPCLLYTSDAADE